MTTKNLRLFSVLTKIKFLNLLLFLVIKEKYLVPPPSKEVDYNFKRKEHVKLNGQANQPILIDEKIFKNRIKNGFFIEAGAYDGELFSNTLFFELKQKWTGLLIEPNPDEFQLLNKKVRQYYTILT